MNEVTWVVRTILDYKGKDKGRVELGLMEGGAPVGFGPGHPDEFAHLMIMAEYLCHLASQKSGAGYERAMELIQKGAMTYRRPKDD